MYTVPSMIVAYPVTVLQLTPKETYRMHLDTDRKETPYWSGMHGEG